MPFGLYLPFKRIPSPKAADNKRGPNQAGHAPPARAVQGLRMPRYGLGLPIGCGLLIGSCAFLIISTGIARAPRRRGAHAADYSGLATSAFETALATRVRAVPTDPQTSPLPTAGVGTTTAPALAAGAAANPWVSDIPEAGCIPADIPQTGIVVEIVDGRTIKVLLDGDGRVFSVRYIGVGPPENSVSPLLASASLTRNSQLAYHKEATLVRDITDADLSGTLLRYAMVDHVFINHALLAGGYVRAASSPPDTACASAFAAAEQDAKARGLGLWAAPLDGTPAPGQP